MDFLLHTADLIDSQIHIAQALCDLAMRATVYGSIVYFIYTFVDGLDFFLPPVPPAPKAPLSLESSDSSEVELSQTEQEKEAILEAIEIQVPVAMPEDETAAEPREGWTPSNEQPATDMESLMAKVKPQQPESLQFSQLKEVPIRTLKKLAVGRLNKYSRDGQEQLAKRLAGKITPQDLQSISV